MKMNTFVRGVNRPHLPSRCTRYPVQFSYQKLELIFFRRDSTCLRRPIHH